MGKKQNRFSFWQRCLSSLGAWVLQLVENLGRISNFSLLVFYWALRPPYRFQLFMDQLYFVGNKSIFIILLSGSFTGMVMAYQTYFGFRLISVDSLVGPVTALSLAKELAPVLTGLIVAGRAGSAMAAQIGTMKVTEQVDALEVMGISSVQYLVAPRVFASLLALPMLSALFLFIGNLGNWFVGTVLLEIHEGIYFSKLSSFIFVEDVVQGLMKAFFFGLVISLVGTYQGMRVTGGAEGVGKGTNRAVVWSMILILVVDYFLTLFLLYLFS